MAFLRSLLFTLIFYAGTVPIVLGTLLFSLFAESARFIIPRAWGQWFLFTTRTILGIRLDIQGATPTPRSSSPSSTSPPSKPSHCSRCSTVRPR